MPKDLRSCRIGHRRVRELPIGRNIREDLLSVEAGARDPLVIAIDPLRRELVQEMHLRPSPAVVAPARIVQILSLIDPGSNDQALRHVKHLGIDTGPGQERRNGAIEREGVRFLWERHSEAATLTAIIDEAAQPEAVQRAMDELLHMPGRVLRAIKIDVVGDRGQADLLCRSRGLDSPETVSGRIGAVEFWSNFVLDETDGFGRLVIFSHGEDRNDLGRIIQQLQELGNYRNLALLGLPLVRGLGDELAELERAIGETISGLSASNDDRAVLARLVDAAVEAARLRSETAFRLGATQAYGEIVCDRLRALDPDPVDGFQSLGEFNNRRLLPALRTCANFRQRLDQLAERIAFASSLLRTRIETELHWQNGELLRSLGETGRAQLHLQRLVEGLSVFAVGYYALGLVGYVLGAIPAEWGVDGHLISGYLVLPVLMIAVFYLKFQRQGRSSSNGEAL